MAKKSKIAIIAGLVVLALIAGAIVLLVLWPFGGATEDTYTPIEVNPVEIIVTDDNLNTVKVPVKEDGTPKEGISGKLVDKLPAQLTSITIENSGGSFTFLVSADSEGSISYVLKGFESFKLADTNPSLIGSSVSNLDIVDLVELSGGKDSDYGLDNPRATARTAFSDGTNSVLYVGDDSAAGDFVFVKYGDCESVFSVAKADVEALLLDFTEMFNKGIRSDYTTVSDDAFTSITLGGTKLKEDIIIEHSDGSLESFYVLKNRNSAPANATASSNVVGTIKSLQAEKVACVNPDSAKLSELGLAKPYATVKATYKYTDEESSEEKTLKVSMLASKPDSEGKVYFMNEGDNIVYLISENSLAWVNVTAEDLRSEYVLSPSYEAVTSMTVSAGGESYRFDVSTVYEQSVDENGDEVSVAETTVKFGDKSISEGYFRTFFESVALLPANADSSSVKGEEIVRVTYEYSTGRSADTVVFYASSSQKVYPSVNGEMNCYVYKADVKNLLANAKALSEGKNSN